MRKSILGSLSILLLAGLVHGAAVPLDEAQITQLFDAGDYKALEAIKDQALSSKERNINGDWQLERFYWIVKKRCDEVAAQSEPDFRARMAAWAEAYPKSVTWRILLAHELTMLGWERRGHGYAPTVTQEGWEGFEKYLKESWTVLQEARNITRQDPELYSEFIDVAQGFGQDPMPGKYLPFGPLAKPIEGIPADKDYLMFAEQILDEAITVEKGYSNLYRSMAPLYLERWYGDRGDLEIFMDRVSSITSADYGDTVYGIVAWSMLGGWGADMYALECDFDWVRIKSGFERLVRDYPASDLLRNEFCYIACMHKDRETAQAARKAIPKPMPWKVWGTPGIMEHWFAWIEGGAEYPLFSELTFAVTSGDTEAVRQLTKSPESLNIIMLSGETPLMISIERADMEMVKLLLELGADVEMAGLSGHTALMVAAMWSDPNFIKLLIDSGADPNKPNKLEAFPLHLAAMGGKVPNAQALIAGKANPNIRNGKGWTPLHAAADRNMPEMVKFLLANGADKNIATNGGSTALDIATKKGAAPVVALLQ